jgi:hypothetical protein
LITHEKRISASVSHPPVTTNPPTRLRKLAAALPHVLVHSALGWLFAAMLGWMEAANRPVNEFNGLFWLIAMWFTGPVACVLAVPLHWACHARAATAFDRHLYSLLISLAMYAAVWIVLQVLTRP